MEERIEIKDRISPSDDHKDNRPAQIPIELSDEVLNKFT